MIGKLSRVKDRICKSDLIRTLGRVKRIVGGVVEAEGLDLAIGDLCEIIPQGPKPAVLSEVVGFKDKSIFLMPLGDLQGIGPNSYFERSKRSAQLAVGPGLLGRVLNEFGQPIDDKGPIEVSDHRPFHRFSPSPLDRASIRDPLSTGIRAIDSVLTCGKGQRMGVFAGSGVGKSVLMGMIARNTTANVSVIALIGERGREIKEFVEQNLQSDGLKRSVVIAVPSDRPPMARIYGALVATSISEYFCEQGQDVLLMLDSATRIAMALREVGLGMGEAPTSRGYTPSVFAFLPKLLERAGNFSHGSITAFYTVLVEGDDMDEPVADTMRSLLDGHIVLSRKLAAQNHYPAIDIPQSISRCMVDITSKKHQGLAGRVKDVLATYRDTEDLIKVGAYVKGNQPAIDDAISRIPLVNAFLQQQTHEKSDFQKIIPKLESIFHEPVKGAQ